MASNRRQTGKRQDRNSKVGQRDPKLGYYLVVTDADGTEQNYFNGMRSSFSSELQKYLVIRVEKAKTTEQLINKTIELMENLPQYSRPWIVFDRDEVVRFDEMIESARKLGIEVGWSNPCFEIWFHAYFGSVPMFQYSQSCWKSFAKKIEKVTGQTYDKNDKDIFKKLAECGDIKVAIDTADRQLQKCEQNGEKPSQSNSATTVYKLVSEIVKKVDK